MYPKGKKIKIVYIIIQIIRFAKYIKLYSDFYNDSDLKISSISVIQSHEPRDSRIHKKCAKKFSKKLFKNKKLAQLRASGRRHQKKICAFVLIILLYSQKAAQKMCSIKMCVFLFANDERNCQNCTKYKKGTDRIYQLSHCASFLLLLFLQRGTRKKES